MRGSRPRRDTTAPGGRTGPGGSAAAPAAGGRRRRSGASVIRLSTTRRAPTCTRAEAPVATRLEPNVLWTPSTEAVERATVTRYRRWLERERGLAFDGYHALWRWSVDDIDAFWASIWDFFDVQSSSPYASVLGRRGMSGAEWFPGAEISYPEHVFRGKQ